MEKTKVSDDKQDPKTGYSRFDKIRTQNSGLDILLRGGIDIPKKENNNGLVILIRGKAGTGKSTLALQMASGLCTELNKRNRSVNPP